MRKLVQIRQSQLAYPEPAMPLSRLTPRSSRTGLARQKTAKSAKNNTQRHLQLWAAIRATQKELDQWQRQVDQVQSLFNEHIVPRERKLTLVVTKITEQLIHCFSSPELDIPDQSLLGLWITDNLGSLRDHPFAKAGSIDQLQQQWKQLLSHDGLVENQLARLARQHDIDPASQYSSTTANSKEQDETYTSTPQDTFAHDNKRQQASDSPESEHDDSCHDKQSDQVDSNAKKQSRHSTCEPDDTQVSDTISSLEDKLSVDRLFRQLAKVLHPDREQDEQAKAAKHVLMSECIKARKENDINALLSLYCEHVGELPDDLNNNSHAELVSALEVQLKNLQLLLRQQRFGDPLQSMIVERYSSSTTADCERRINTHAQSLDEEIAAAQRQSNQLADKDGLLDALDARRALEQDRMSINELTGM